MYNCTLYMWKPASFFVYTKTHRQHIVTCLTQPYTSIHRCKCDILVKLIREGAWKPGCFKVVWYGKGQQKINFSMFIFHFQNIFFSHHPPVPITSVSNKKMIQYNRSRMEKEAPKRAYTVYMHKYSYLITFIQRYMYRTFLYVYVST
jgi:hypothetical protein